MQGRVGDTLVTSIDARVQAVVEQQLAQTIKTARATVDEVTGRPYVADSGAAVVMEADTGRIVAMASQPTYDPKLWVGGISESELQRLYSDASGTPLLSRATQGQFAPGSTWKPFMTAGALGDGYSPEHRSWPAPRRCASATVTSRTTSPGPTATSASRRPSRSPATPSSTGSGSNFWQKYGSDVADVDAKDPLVEEAKEFGFGSTTGIDIPGEATGRIADRKWKLEYYESMKDYYCEVGEEDGYDFLHRFAREFCVEGFAYRAGDAVNFAIGQGDTVVTPLQLARGYAALSNGGTLYEPSVGKAIVDPAGEVVKEIEPKVQAQGRRARRATSTSSTSACRTSPRSAPWPGGCWSSRSTRSPIRAKTGSAEVYGKQTTSWVASYTKDYVVVMMVSQGGTGSGTSGPAIRKIYETLYGVKGMKVVPDEAAIPGVAPPERLPVFAEDGSILPPSTTPAANDKDS